MLSTLGMPIDAIARRRERSLLSRNPTGRSDAAIRVNVKGNIGTLEVRLARTRAELKRAQRLRFRVFYREMSAKPNVRTRLLRRDTDRFDALCDHLLVFDHAKTERDGGPKIVGTYRLLRQDIAEQQDGFYTQGEFDVASMIARHPASRFLELGRSCVLPEYRTKRTVELLWHGIWAYVLAHKIDVMFGCASFPGIRSEDNAMALSFLSHFAKPTKDWHVKALDSLYVPMDVLPKSSVNPRTAIKDLPPLIKGYLRLGGKIGEGAVIDHQFGTTDVLIVLPVTEIDQRYINHYGAEANRFAA